MPSIGEASLVHAATRHNPELEVELSRMREQREVRAQRLMQQLETLSASTSSGNVASTSLVANRRRSSASSAASLHPVADDIALLANLASANPPPRLPAGWSDHAITNPALPGLAADAPTSTTMTAWTPSSGAIVPSSTALVVSHHCRGMLQRAHADHEHLSTDSAATHEHSRRANELLRLMRSRDSRRWLRAWLRQEGRVDRLLDLLETAHPTVCTCTLCTCALCTCTLCTCNYPMHMHPMRMHPVYPMHMHPMYMHPMHPMHRFVKHWSTSFHG